MAKRKIVKIDESLCNGCGECVSSCAEGAIQIIDGKARLVSDQYCDGLGACLGECPQGAISIEEREAKSFDEAAAKEHLHRQAHGDGHHHHDHQKHHHGHHQHHEHHAAGCPGAAMRQLGQRPAAEGEQGDLSSQLRQWPVQLHLVSPLAPYFKGADLLLAADCVAYAYGAFHSRFLKGRSIAVACPKLDSQQEVYLDKLVTMIDEAKINTLNVVIMEVPCCSGLMRLAQAALSKAKRKVPIKEIVVSLEGEVLSEEWR